MFVNYGSLCHHVLRFDLDLCSIDIKSQWTFFLCEWLTYLQFHEYSSTYFQILCTYAQKLKESHEV